MKTLTIDHALDTMDHARERFHDADVEGGYADLSARLDEVRQNVGAEEWRFFTEDVAPRHPLFAMFQQDPMVRRCVEKPRGYAGDARLLDMIYDGRAAIDTPTSDFGWRLFDCGFRAAPSRAVRERSRRLADIIDTTASRGGRRVLAVAAGHLREAEWTPAVARGEIDTLVAMDQDAASLRVIERRGHRGVETAALGARDLLRGAWPWTSFDLIYSAGLYDYLPDAFARRLTASMFEHLAPGGRLVVANFTPDNPSIGFMEAIMQWKLIYRDDDAMLSLADRIDPDAIGRIQTFGDRSGVVSYLDVERAGSPCRSSQRA